MLALKRQIKAITIGSLVSLSRGMSANAAGFPVMAPDSLMNAKSHGTCDHGVQKQLLWNIDNALADRICCFNRHYAEPSGSFEYTSWPKEISKVNTSAVTILYPHAPL